jgi:hypothetical protein
VHAVKVSGRIRCQCCSIRNATRTVPASVRCSCWLSVRGQMPANAAARLSNAGICMCNACSVPTCHDMQGQTRFRSVVTASRPACAELAWHQHAHGRGQAVSARWWLATRSFTFKLAMHALLPEQEVLAGKVPDRIGSQHRKTCEPMGHSKGGSWHEMKGHTTLTEPPPGPFCRDLDPPKSEAAATK